jgi:Gluconate 2-dehydrogenase subunit 3
LFFNPEQLEEIAALCETIIPTDDHSPGARAAAVHQYIDDVVAVADQKTKDVWTQVRRRWIPWTSSPGAEDSWSVMPAGGPSY